MKVRMFMDRHTFVCKFICAGCDKPIDDIREANFAPVKADSNWQAPIKLSRELCEYIDEPDIWHWDCDQAGYPWQNAAEAIKPYIDAGIATPDIG